MCYPCITSHFDLYVCKTWAEMEGNAHRLLLVNNNNALCKAGQGSLGILDLVFVIVSVCIFLYLLIECLRVWLGLFLYVLLFLIGWYVI